MGFRENSSNRLIIVLKGLFEAMLKDSWEFEWIKKVEENDLNIKELAANLNMLGDSQQPGDQKVYKKNLFTNKNNLMYYFRLVGLPKYFTDLCSSRRSFLP
jgi:hypothetical protein